MSRFPVYVFALLLFSALNLPVAAEELTAIQIFDGMIHYEKVQLSSQPGVNDFHCKITQTTQRTAISVADVTVKDLYFLTPSYQLFLVDDQPVGYFDEVRMVDLLEMNDLKRLRDETIEGIPCYVIKMQPLDPAFSKYSRTYYVAKDDFRHVRTVAHHASDQYDSLNTITDYNYGTAGDFVMLLSTSSATSDDNGNVLANMSAVYSDYEYGIGIDLDFILSYTEREGIGQPIPQLN